MSKLNIPKVYHIFQVEYSQTDRSMIIVEAATVEEARRWLLRHGEHGPRYVNYYGSSNIVKVAT